MPNELILFINAIVVALMAMYVYNNERRLEEILAKCYRTEAQMTLDISKNEKRIEEMLAEQKKDQLVVAQITLNISKNEKRIGEISAEQKKDQSVVAQMILDISKNVKRIGEISAEQKKDQSGKNMTSVAIMFINAIVVAQMTLSISKNEKRIGDISVEQKKDQSDIKPAFAAYFNKDAYGYISLARGQILIFDRVQLNVGGGYNTGTGYFTVPRTGLYLVSCKLRSQANRHLHVFLMKNHNKVALSYGGNYNEGSFTLPVQVDKGDQLVITHDAASYVNDEYVQGGIISFFSAVFISD